MIPDNLYLVAVQTLNPYQIYLFLIIFYFEVLFQIKLCVGPFCIFKVAHTITFEHTYLKDAINKKMHNSLALFR